MATKQKMPDLSGFYGSETQYRHALAPTTLYTEGVKYLADKLGAHWFVDIITSYQHTAPARKEDFQIWTITLNGEGHKYPSGCVVTMKGDTDWPEVIRQEIDHTDFPENFECWAERNHLGGVTIMLKSER